MEHGSGSLIRRGMIAGLFLCGTVRLAPGQAHPPHLHQKEEGTPPPGQARSIPHTDERAGHPRCLREHLEPSFTPGVKGYYVGGGAAHGGRGQCAGDGTWGWDDTGCAWMPVRARLRWSHGRRYQGGTGAYASDGPHVPDPIAGTFGLLKNHRAAGDEGKE